MALNIGTLTGYLRLSATHFNRGVQAARREMASLKKDADKTARDISAIGDAAAGIGRPAGMAALAAGAVSISAAAAPAAGVLLAGASAALVMGGAFAAGQMATSGMGDALSALAEGDAAKAAEALAKLSPNAQIAVRAMDGVRKSFEGVQQRVQDRVFEGLGQEISAVGATYLPILDRGLVGIAGSLNTVAASFLLAARGSTWMTAVNDILGATGPIVENLGTAALGLVTSLLMVGRAAMPMMTAFAQWAADGMATAAAFLSSAEGAAWLAAKVDGAQRAMGLLWDLTSAIGSLIVGVFGAAQGSGEGLLVTLTGLVQKAAEWANSAEGQAELGRVFESLRIILEALLGTFAIFGGAITTLLDAFSQLPTPVQTVVASFLSWSLLLGTLASKFAPLLGVLGKMGGLLGRGGAAIVMAAARWGLLGTAAKAASTITGATLRLIVGAMSRAAILMMGRAIVMAAAWLVALGPVGWLVLAVVAIVAAAVALIVMHWDKVKAALVAVGEFFMALPGMVGDALAWLGTAIAEGATAAWNWLVTTASDAINAALEWLAALPERVAFALGYLAGLVYMGALAAWRFISETVPEAIDAALAWLASLPGRVLEFLAQLGTQIATGARNAWNWFLTTAVEVGTAVLDWVRALPGRIGAFISALPGILRNAATSAWNGFRDTTISVATNVLNWIRELPGKIRAFFSGAGQWLMEAGRQIVNGLLNGLKSMAQGVLDYIKNLGKRVADGFKAAVGIHSPSRVFADHGVNIGKGVIVGLDRITPKVLGATRGLGHDVSAAFGRPGMTGSSAGSLDSLSPEEIGAAVEAGVGRALASGRMTLRVDGRGVARLVNKQNAEDYRLGSARHPVLTGRR